MKFTAYIIVFLITVFSATAAEINNSECSEETNECECGFDIIGDYTLSFDLDCNGTGLNIKKDGVVLDCNNFKISGNSNNRSKNIRGINITGYDNVTIQNCLINNFSTGIHAENASGLEILDNEIVENGFGTNDISGIRFENVQNSEIRNNIIKDNDHGIYIKKSSNNTFTNNTVNDNWFQGYYVDNSHNNTFSDGEVSDNNQECCIGSEGGMYLSDSDYNTIENIYLHNNEYSAVYFTYSDFNILQNNKIENNLGQESGVYIYNSDNLIVSGNNITNETGLGIEIYYSINNSFLNNKILNNSDAGIYVEGDGDTSNQLFSQNTIIGNNVTQFYMKTDADIEINNNIINCDNESVGIYIDEVYDLILSGNKVSNCDIGEQILNADNVSIADETFNNNRGLYILYSGKESYSDGDLIVRDSSIHDNCEGAYIVDTYIDIENMNFENNNKENCNGTGLKITSTQLDLVNGNFTNNGQYGLIEIGNSGRVQWTITEDAICQNNDFKIENGWIIPLGGQLTAENCTITVEEDELNFSGGQQGLLKSSLDTSGDGQDSVGGEAYGFEADITTESSFTGTLDVEFFNENPGESGFALTEFGKFLDVNPSSNINLTNWTLKIFYTNEELVASTLEESSLRIQYYNATSETWTQYDSPDGGVNTTGNYTWATINHFSVFGIFGSTPPAPTPSKKRSSGGGSSSCFPQWECDEWSECVSGRKTRTCSDKWNCGTGKSPKTEQECEIVKEDIEEKEEEKETPTQDVQQTPKEKEEEKEPEPIAITPITGAVVGGEEETSMWWLGMLGLVVALVIFVSSRLRKY